MNSFQRVNETANLLLLLGGDLLLGLGDLLLPPWYPLLGGLLPPRWGERLRPPLLNVIVELSRSMNHSS